MFFTAWRMFKLCWNLELFQKIPLPLDETKGKRWKWLHVYMLNRVRLFVTLWSVVRQASVGFSRQEYWDGLSCPPPGIFPIQRSNPWLCVSCIAGDFYRWALDNIHGKFITVPLTSQLKRIIITVLLKTEFWQSYHICRKWSRLLSYWWLQ